ncbi:hypothetical protein HRbin27_02032 [bacterium HR27]|nr:hypothetical protein HRbin27_02032 [bacterium HR27]
MEHQSAVSTSACSGVGSPLQPFAERTADDRAAPPLDGFEQDDLASQRSAFDAFERVPGSLGVRPAPEEERECRRSAGERRTEEERPE